MRGAESDGGVACLARATAPAPADGVCMARVHGMCTACAWHVHWRVQEQRTDLRPLPDTGAGRGAAGGLAIGETVILLTLPLHHY